ncbi:uncharacterized protein TNIN_142031 [Trichonephila inaurata madagascariensis]|uniref:Uncharacterized protein n=1 Tax=Trichonephila inaurata madagascariensis TaxID=2747483 RepID=A0A8X6XPF2_9ARAC|nr:uncharacterized protein TNIN_142031 [Trichonephila inaurata madagascariensis]
MKRSSSVPCRATMPSVSISSPVRTNATIMELNDLNKDASQSVPEENEDSQEPVQRKYSLDSHERSKQRVSLRTVSNCDNMYSQECLDESDTVMEMQVAVVVQAPRLGFGEDFDGLRPLPRPPPKNVMTGSSNIAIPGIHHSRHCSSDVNGMDMASRSARYRSANDPCDTSSVGTSSGGSFQENPNFPKEKRGNPNVRPCTSIR